MASSELRLPELNFNDKPSTLMVTRQLRLNTLDQFQKRLKEFIGKKINIVLVNRTVLFGELRSITDTQLTCVNMRMAPFTLSLTEISEVYLDFKE